MNLLVLNLVWVALGGALGSVARAALGMAIQTRFPWATLIINVTGSCLVGWLMARVGPAEVPAALSLRSLLVTGFCGGYTTFSMFSWQTLDQMQKGQWLWAGANVLLSVTLSLAAVWLGFRLGRA